jgi:protein TonB
MERPSHITLTSGSFHSRLPLFALAAFLQAAIVWMFAHGLHTSAIHIPPDLTFRLSPDTPTEKTPPPKPVDIQKIELPKTVTPIFETAPVERNETGITTMPPQTGTTTPAATALPSHAAVGITGTHTTPPYPPVALRTGEEGKVTLQLAIAPTGRVTRADVLVSSGHDDLDRSAQDWIVAHWAYRPALDKGEPVAGQAMATVTFSLKNAR